MKFPLRNIASLGITVSLLCTLSSAGYAADSATTPNEFIREFSAAAPAGFTASAERGKAFFTRKFGVSSTLESCAACHTSNPAQKGKHVVTGKEIQAMAPAANPERFTDAKKVDKWFRRNCTEVVGRECTPAEKADLIQFFVKAS